MKVKEIIKKENLLYLGLFVISVVISQFVSYFYHRFCHSALKTIINYSHDIHHKDSNKGHEDYFLMISFYLLLVVFPTMYLLKKNYYNIAKYKKEIYTILISSLILFTYEWFLHSSYHSENHWLNRFKWFRKRRLNHLEHHKNVNRNLGISNEYTDKLSGSYISSNKNTGIQKKKLVPLSTDIDLDMIFNRNIEIEEFDDPLEYLY